MIIMEIKREPLLDFYSVGTSTYRYVNVPGAGVARRIPQHAFIEQNLIGTLTYRPRKKQSDVLTCRKKHRIKPLWPGLPGQIFLGNEND
jgi:hypothetical protein